MPYFSTGSSTNNASEGNGLIRDACFLSKKINMFAQTVISSQTASSFSENRIDELFVSRIDLASFPRLWSERLFAQFDLLVMVDAESESSKKFELVDGCWAVIDTCRLLVNNPTSSICQSFEFTFDKIFNCHLEGKIITTLLEVSFKPSMLIGGISMWYDFAYPDICSFREFFEGVMTKRVKQGHPYVFDNYIKPLQFSLKRLTLLARSVLGHFKWIGMDHLKVCEQLKVVYASTINLGLPERKVQLDSTGGAGKGVLDMDMPKVACENSEPVKVPSVPSFSKSALSLFHKLKTSKIQSDLSNYTMLVTQIHSTLNQPITTAEEEYFALHQCKYYQLTSDYQSLDWDEIFSEYLIENKTSDGVALLEMVVVV